MKHLFIDTNRYLLLYGFPKEDLEEIRKIVTLITNGKITLWLPEQVKNEFYRNRDKIPLEKCEQLKKVIPDLKIPKLPEIPEFKKEFNEIRKSFEEIKKIGKKINTKIESLITSIKSSLKKESFLADKILVELFSAAKILKYDEEIIKKAKIRYDLDMPPGKKGSYGDAVIWETLLKEFPEGEDLHFVGFDNDFRSNIDNDEFSPFLLKEWKDRKKSDIMPYKHLGEFTKSKIPEIEQSDKIIEEEKRLDKNYLITNTALSEALKEIAANLNVYQNTIAHALDSASISKDFFRQQAELSRRFTETINKSLENIKIPSSVFADALKAYEPFRESIAKEATEKTSEHKKDKKKDS